MKCFFGDLVFLFVLKTLKYGKHDEQVTIGLLQGKSIIFFVAAKYFLNSLRTLNTDFFKDTFVLLIIESVCLFKQKKRSFFVSIVYILLPHWNEKVNHSSLIFNNSYHTNNQSLSLNYCKFTHSESKILVLLNKSTVYYESNSIHL